MSTEIALTKIEDSDKDEKGNLTVVAREKIKEDLDVYIKRLGTMNYYRMAKQLGLNRMTVIGLVNELVDDWSKTGDIEMALQVEWYKQILEDIELHPEYFTPQRVTLIAFKAGIIDRLNAINKIIRPGAYEDEEKINFNVFGQIKPKTLAALAARRNNQGSSEPVEVTEVSSNK
jgi:hypothetical protein